MPEVTPQTPFTIRDVARFSGLPASTLRYYESIGLLTSVARDPSSGHRRYSDDDVNLATAIACLSAAGLPLPEMREYLANRPAGVSAAAAQIELLSGHAHRLTVEADELKLRRRYIDSKLAYWHALRDGDEMRQESLRVEVNDLAAKLHSAGMHGAAKRYPGRPAA